jgi:hypothetical protein
LKPTVVGANRSEICNATLFAAPQIPYLLSTISAERNGAIASIVFWDLNSFNQLHTAKETSTFMQKGKFMHGTYAEAGEDLEHIMFS